MKILRSSRIRAIGRSLQNQTSTKKIFILNIANIYIYIITYALKFSFAYPMTAHAIRLPAFPVGNAAGTVKIKQCE